MRALSAAVLAGALVVGGAPALARPVHIGMSTALIDSNPVAVWAWALRDELGRHGIQTRVYPGSTLGSELERDEQVILGLLPINISGGQDVTQYSPMLRSFRMPFLFRKTAEVDCLMHRTGFLELVNAATRARGIEVVDVVTVGGMASLFTSSGPIDSLTTLRAQRIRAMDRYQVSTIESWGASSVQVAWEEVTTALQTSVVDGYLNPPGVPLAFRHTRHLRHMLALDLFTGIRFVTLSAKWSDGLDDAARAALEAALVNARRANRAFAAARRREDLDGLRAMGVTISEPDAEFLAELAASVSWMYEDLLGSDTMNTVTDLLENECRAY